MGEAEPFVTRRFWDLRNLMGQEMAEMTGGRFDGEQDGFVSCWRLRKRVIAPMRRVFFLLKEVGTGFGVEPVTEYEGSFGGRRCGV